ARCDVVEPRDLDLEPRLTALRMALEDREDHRGAIEHLGAGRALEVARLRGSELVVDEYQSRAVGALGCRNRGVLGLVLLRPIFCLVVGGPLPARPDRHDARSTGPLGELLQLSSAHDGPRIEPGALLRHAPDHGAPEALREPGRLVVRSRQLRLAHPPAATARRAAR